MEDAQLVALAWEARENAYCPYSKYAVGAALLDAEGKVFLGCNVENVSYPAGICAERTAVVKMVSEGGTQIAALAVATSDGGMPCGICLQVLLEFANDPSKIKVLTSSEIGTWKTFSLLELFPHGFTSKAVLPESQENLAYTEPPARARPS